MSSALIWAARRGNRAMAWIYRVAHRDHEQWQHGTIMLGRIAWYELIVKRLVEINGTKIHAMGTMARAALTRAAQNELEAVVKLFHQVARWVSIIDTQITLALWVVQLNTPIDQRCIITWELKFFQCTRFPVKSGRIGIKQKSYSGTSSRGRDKWRWKIGTTNIHTGHFRGHWFLQHTLWFYLM